MQIRSASRVATLHRMASTGVPSVITSQVPSSAPSASPIENPKVSQVTTHAKRRPARTTRPAGALRGLRGDRRGRRWEYEALLLTVQIAVATPLMACALVMLVGMPVPGERVECPPAHGWHALLCTSQLSAPSPVQPIDGSLPLMRPQSLEAGTRVMSRHPNSCTRSGGAGRPGARCALRQCRLEARWGSASHGRQ